MILTSNNPTNVNLVSYSVFFVFNLCLIMLLIFKTKKAVHQDLIGEIVFLSLNGVMNVLYKRPYD